MKHIYRKISLEPFKSRYCGLINSFDNGNYVIFNFGDSQEISSNDLVEDVRVPKMEYTTFSVNVGENFTSNYSMIPSDVKIDGNTYSYPTLRSIYLFLKEYYNTLQYSSLCGKKEYATYESMYNDNIPLPNVLEIEDAIKIDEKVKNFGGKEFYEKISKKYFPSFPIPLQFQDAWNKTLLNIYEVDYWLGYFGKYLCSENDCKDDSQNCFECKKCLRLGGDEIYNAMTSWYCGLFGSNEKGETNEAHIDIRLNITNSIEDMGEFSIFSTEYESNEDYTNQISCESSNCYGTSVLYNLTDYLKKGKGNGNNFCEKWREDYFDTYQWESGFEVYKESNPNEFYNAQNESDKTPTSFTIVNDKVLYSSDYKLDNLMYAKHQIYTNGNLGYFYINGIIYPIVESDYIEIGNKKIRVRYEKKVQDEDDALIEIHPYILQNNKKIYADKLNNKFIFKNNVKINYISTDFDNCSEIETYEISSLTKAYFIEYRHNDIEVDKIDDSHYSLTFNAVTMGIPSIYENIYGYIIAENEIVPISNDHRTCSLHLKTEYADTKGTKKSNNYEVSEIDWRFGNFVEVGDGFDFEKHKNEYYYTNVDDYIIEMRPFNVFTFQIITAKTESKLNMFKIEDLTTDELGNTFFGCSDLVDEYPKELNIPFKPNTIADNPTLVNDNGTKIWWCSYLSSIAFYYEDYPDTTEPLGVDDNTFDCISRLRGRITNYVNEDTLKCKIVYYVGCLLEEGDVDTNGNIQYSIVNGCEGVKYVDTYSMKLENQPFYISDISSYLIKLYTLTNDLNEEVKYGNSTTTIGLSEIEYRENIDIENPNNVYYDITKGYNASPIFKREYLMGISSLEKVTGDIYIDRGMSQAFDKHLKLMEVKSLEALEQYTNGYFKINKS